MKWSRRRVIVTGGAGFIGGALVDKLLGLGASVTVVDKVLVPKKLWAWKAKLDRLSAIYKKHGFKDVELSIIDLATERDRFQLVAEKHDLVFHLSAVFGGREFVDKRQVECSKMLAIDHNVISASYEAGVERIHYASSACVYPPVLNKPRYLLTEEDILTTGDGWQSSDNLYGFAKLMGELQLRVYHKEKGLKGSICRYLTVYGPGEFDTSHAIPSLIQRALERQDPYVIWGSGNQERGFTYVDDIIEGSVLAAEKIDNASAVNLGWNKRYKLRDVAKLVLKVCGHKPSRIYFDLKKPEGPYSRALDISRAQKLLAWRPKVDLAEGIVRAADWHRTFLAREGHARKLR